MRAPLKNRPSPAVPPSAEVETLRHVKWPESPLDTECGCHGETISVRPFHSGPEGRQRLAGGGAQRNPREQTQNRCATEVAPEASGFPNAANASSAPAGGDWIF